ncbi:TlpA family protein disulfide reductase [Sulfurivermis fontis]|uniref:TlpA family protein disulfide reductase n=1 Tax=Sulfurivermis fontis TaxID=1972068 RepID=UPI000FD8757A|nr:TlpA disulfide reductase family protein [Sulfurivermis fontis]
MHRLLPVLALGAVLFTAGCGSETSAVPAAPASHAAATPIAFNFPDLEGKQRHLNEWQGRVVLLNFWAPWCPPCREEMPALMELQEKYAARGLTVVGITIDTRENAQSFADSLGIDFPILIGEEGGLELAQTLGNKVGALPYTVVLDRQGRAVYTHRSEITLQQAEEAVLPLL